MLSLAHEHQSFATRDISPGQACLAQTDSQAVLFHPIKMGCCQTGWSFCTSFRQQFLISGVQTHHIYSEYITPLCLLIINLKCLQLWCFQPVNYYLFLDAFQQKFSSCVRISVLESLYECMQRCRCCSHSQKLVSADTYFVIMITSPRTPLHRMHTTEKNAEKQLEHKCTVLARVEFVPYRTGSHMTHWGVTTQDWVKTEKTAFPLES